MAKQAIEQNLSVCNAEPPATSPDFPAIKLVDGRPTVLSVQVAAHFGKPHHRVLHSIREMIKDLPENIRASNFRGSAYTVKTGLGFEREYPAYDISRDGFTLLAMGFTGKKAMAWKVKYIQAFNDMEAKLSCPAPPALTLSTSQDRAPLRDLVKQWCSMTQLNRTEAWGAIKHRFGIARLDHLPVEWMEEALKFVQERIEAEKGCTLFKQSRLACTPDPTPPALPAVTATDADELKEILEDYLQFEARTRREFRDIANRLTNITGPLYQNLLFRLGWRNANPPFMPDNIISTMHHTKYKSMDGLNAALENFYLGIKTAQDVTKALAK